MAKLPTISTKHLQIDKANAQVVASVAVASFLLVFSLIASKALLNQRSYQGKIIQAKETAVKQLKSNVNSAKSLTDSYTAFVGTPQNIIGGNPSGTGDRDGDNAKIVLDALPSQYDFPALASSLEKILTAQNYKIQSISGTDDELNQQKDSAGSGAPVPIPFQISVSGNYASMQSLASTLERSIRPIQIQKITFSGSSDSMNAVVSAQTYYQPEKTLTITKKAIK